MLKDINYQPKLIPWLISQGEFKDEPVRILDIGARAGLEEHWQFYEDRIKQIGFEPDINECERLNRESNNSNHKFYPVALGRKQETRPFSVCEWGGSSSFYPANMDYLKRFADENGKLMQVKEQIELETIDLDTFSTQEQLGEIDFIKLDVEGSELDILQGGKNCLHNVMGLSLEVLFHNSLRHQPTFSEIDLWLSSHGFKLFDLALYRHARKALPLPANSLGASEQGQVLWGQALYLRDAVAEMNENSFWSRERILKLASMMELFCLPDCAIELLQEAAAKNILTESIESLCNLLVPQIYSDKQPTNISYANYLKTFQKV